MINVIQNTIGVGSLAFNPSQLTNGAVWYDPASDYINVKAGAKFTAANSEELTSTSTDFDKGDEDFSFGGWVRINSGTANQGICGKFLNTGNQRSYILYTNVADQRFRLAVSNDGVATVAAQWGSTLTQNQYYFVVCVHDSVNNLIKISVDGGTYVTTAHTTGIFDSSATFRFGDYGGGVNADMTCDHWFFYDKALSQSEVSTLYNSGNGQPYADMDKTSLVSFWEFDEASGNRADTHGTNTLTDVNTVTTGAGKVQSSLQDQDIAWKITDRYGNHDLSNDDGAGQPIWNQNSGLPFLEFDGVDDFLSKDVADWLSGSTTGSIYMVCQSDSTNTAENGFCSSDNATDNHYLAVQNSVSSLNDSSRILTRISGTVASVYGDTDITDSTVRLLEFHSNGTAYELLINSTSQTVNEQTGGDDTGNFYGDVSNRDNISMGALLRSSVLYFPSKFFEIIVTSSESSAVEKLNVRNYLTNKYSI